MADQIMNLTVLQQRDPFIVEIVETASQVALYSFNSHENDWQKTDIAGTLFVYSRSVAPVYVFTILNRNGLENQTEPITNNLEFQLQDPFLLYKTSKEIFGIWFFDKDECARIGQLMNSLVQVTNRSQESIDHSMSRQRRASDSDSMHAIPIRPNQGLNDGSSPATSSAGVDILQMLFRAQSEYNSNSNKGQRGNGENNATKSPVLINSTTPLVLKPNPIKSVSNPFAIETKHDSPKSIPIESLFQNMNSKDQVKNFNDFLKRDTNNSVQVNESKSTNHEQRTSSPSFMLKQTLNINSIDNSVTPPSGVAQKFITPVQLQTTVTSSVLPPNPVNLLTPIHTGMLQNSTPTFSKSASKFPIKRHLNMGSDFQSSYSQQSPQIASITPHVSFLTKDQMQQAMLYLIKNDDEFINKLHDAYLRSLQDNLNTHKDY